jgi:hypothetical protein
MPIDLVWILVLLLQFFFFSIGVGTLLSPWMGKNRYELLPFFFSLGALLNTAIVSLLACIPVASVPMGSALVFALELLGVLAWARHRPALPSWHTRFPYLFLFLGPLYVWWVSWEGTPAIISFNDGTAHMGYLARIIESGNPLLPFIPRPFAAQFGGSPIPFYPTGTHALIAMFQGWWIQAEWLTQAQALRSWMVVTHALLPLWVVWIVQFLFPGRSRWLSLGVGMLSFTYWLYPVWAANSGGYSRAVGQFLVLPLAAWTLSKGLSLEGKKRNGWMHALLIPGCLGAFSFHASSFALFALITGTVFLMQSFFYWKDKAWVLRNVCQYGCAVGAGLGVLGLFLQRTGSINTIDMASREMTRWAPFTWSGFISRLGEVVHEFFHAGYSAPFGWAIYQWVLLIGLVMVALPLVGVRAFRSAQAELRRVSPVLFYVLVTCGIVSVLATTYFSPLYAFYRVGLLFLQTSGRLAEMQYLFAIVLWVQGGMGLGALYAYLKRKGSLLSHVLVGVGVVLMLVEFRVAVKSQIRHLRAYRDIYHTQTYEATEGLMAYIRTHTEKDSLFLQAPFVADSLESRTGRKGLFTYGECPGLGSADPVCEKRKIFSNEIHAELKTRLQVPDATQDCFLSLASFSQPLYWITQESEFPSEHGPKSAVVCKNLRWVKNENTYSLWKYVSK